jgi:heme/copper-type cytochrome/quinol oxidase subunit 4
VAPITRSLHDVRSVPHLPRQDVSLDERWQTFIAFWLLAGLTLLTVGIAVLAAVSHGHRIAAVLLLAGVICLAVGFTVWRAGRRRD